jgi:fructokinase
VLKLGIDIGGTKIECVLLSQSGSVMARKRALTSAEKGLHHILEVVKGLVTDILKGVNTDYTIGVGAPGSVSLTSNLHRNSNTLCLNDVPLKRLIEEKLERKVWLENDANCFTLAEAVYGAGKNHRVVFGVILGTGCGGGISIDRKIFLGKNRMAGEFGHHSISISDDNVCWCGRKGCVEKYISGSGIENQYFFITGEKTSAIEIFKKSDLAANKIKKFFFERLGVSIANVCNILDPDVVVIGGGLSNQQTIYSIGKREVVKNIFSDSFNTPIRQNILGDSAGVIGAALLPVSSSF